jgi:chromate reductase
VSDAIEVIAICGSLRRDSLNAALVRALPALAPAGMRIVPSLRYRELPPYDADLHLDAFPEGVIALANQWRTADALMVVSPEYNYSVPGALKNAIDWVSRVPRQPFARKPMALQSASAGLLGGARMQYHLRQMLVYLDADVLNLPEVFIADAAARIDPVTNEIIHGATREIVARQLIALARHVRRSRSAARVD